MKQVKHWVKMEKKVHLEQLVQTNKFIKRILMILSTTLINQKEFVLRRRIILMGNHKKKKKQKRKDPKRTKMAKVMSEM